MKTGPIKCSPFDPGALHSAGGLISCWLLMIHRKFILNSSPCVSMARIEVAG
jgi:hypothetical protein